MSHQGNPPFFQRYRDEAATFIDDWANWTHVFTGTYPCGRPRSAVSRDYRCLRDLLAGIGGREHVPIALAIEPQANGTPHIHMLIAVPATYQGGAAHLLRRHWHRLTGGNAQVRSYAPFRRAGNYLVGHATWELDYACP